MKVDGRTAEDDNQARSTVTLDLERGHLGSILLCKVLHEGLHEELEARLDNSNVDKRICQRNSNHQKCLVWLGC